MKVSSIVKAQVLAKNTTKSQDGKSTYYNLAVLVGGEAGNLKCTEEVFERAVIGEVAEFNAEYSDQYNSFRLTQYIAPVKANSPTTAK